ncbi:hypothetical protein A0H81_10780 [Grifola frondosa]|uniref:Uncharacterized protein n=1 Tax=Grifola frondosa TaxID=5627 RepID=A0A1C7LXZ0_GRIFR|nr:hypothetical protein A0H81_10780 [Grifola frondosa]
MDGRSRQRSFAHSAELPERDNILDRVLYCGCVPLPWATIHPDDGGSPVALKFKKTGIEGRHPLLEKMVSRLAPSLEVLWLLPARRISTLYGKHNIHFPKLRAFILSEGFGWGAPPPTWTVPSLQILFTDDDDFSTASLSNLYRFMKTNGHQLRHLIACRSTVCNLQFCSNLLEWTLPCGMVHLAFRMSDQCHPSIRCLTLIDDMCCNYTMKLDHVFILHKWVVDAFFPALECIRFLLPLGRLVRQYRPRTEWTQAFELLTNACRIRAIRLEVSIGADDHTAGIWQPFFVDQLLL